MLDTNRLFEKDGLIQTLVARECSRHMKCTQAAEC